MVTPELLMWFIFKKRSLINSAVSSLNEWTCWVLIFGSVRLSVHYAEGAEWMPLSYLSMISWKKRMKMREENKYRGKRVDRSGHRGCRSLCFAPVASPVNTAQMWWLNTVSVGLAGCGVSVCELWVWVCVCLWDVVVFFDGSTHANRKAVCVCALWPPATMSISQVGQHNDTHIKHTKARPSVLCLSHCFLWPSVKSGQAGLKPNMNPEQNKESDEDIRQDYKHS